MRGVNKVILIGHLGKDPEVQTFEGGNMKCKFTLATTETFKDKSGQKQEQTEWHNIVMWGSLADIASKFLRKGTPVYLEGKIKSRSWDDAQSGQKKYITEIVADNMNMLGGKESGSSSNGNNFASNSSQSAPSESFSGVDSPADNLPF
jgi:single-strand DNA-binding protein